MVSIYAGWGRSGHDSDFSGTEIVVSPTSKG